MAEARTTSGGQRAGLECRSKDTAAGGAAESRDCRRRSPAVRKGTSTGDCVGVCVDMEGSSEGNAMAMA